MQISPLAMSKSSCKWCMGTGVNKQRSVCVCVYRKMTKVQVQCFSVVWVWPAWGIPGVEKRIDCWWEGRRIKAALSAKPRQSNRLQNLPCASPVPLAELVALRHPMQRIEPVRRSQTLPARS